MPADSRPESHVEGRAGRGQAPEATTPTCRPLPPARLPEETASSTRSVDSGGGPGGQAPYGLSPHPPRHPSAHVYYDPGGYVGGGPQALDREELELEV